MHRLVKRAAAAIRVRRAERGRGQHAERARRHGRLVGQDVAEQIVGDDHVELLRRAHELHGAIVGEDVLELHVGIAFLVHARDDLVPQHAGLHDVTFLGRVHEVLALARQVESDGGDALDLVGLVDLGVDGALLAVAEIGDLFGSPK